MNTPAGKAISKAASCPKPLCSLTADPSASNLPKNRKEKLHPNPLLVTGLADATTDTEKDKAMKLLLSM